MRRFKVVFCYPCFENLGIEYLSAVLRNMDIETELVLEPGLFNDPYIQIPFLARLFDRSRSLPLRIIEREPDLVAFSVLACNYRWALETAKKIKNLADVPIVFGGIHALSAPDAVIENKQVDYCIVGEGEEPLAELASALRDGADPTKILNLHCRKNGDFVKNPLRPLIENLDGLPFPDKELYYREIPGFAKAYTLNTRRGCLYRCSYCHHTVWEKQYPGSAGRIRLRSVDNVMEELTTALLSYDFKRLRINDDLFSHDINWLMEFCRRYKTEVNRPFLCSCSPNHMTGPVVKALKDAGCFQVCIGIQDVQESIRREVYNRHTPQENIVAALDNLKRHRLWATVDNILGYENQTEEDIKKIATFYLDNPVYGRFTLFRLIYFAGTRITEHAREQGAITDKIKRELERDPPRDANTLYGDRISKRVHLLTLFLIIIQWLPRSISRWMLKLELYRFLPPVNPSVVESLWTMFTKDRRDPIRKRYYLKYWHFGRPRFMVKKYPNRYPRGSI